MPAPLRGRCKSARRFLETARNADLLGTRNTSGGTAAALRFRASIAFRTAPKRNGHRCLYRRPALTAAKQNGRLKPSVLFCRSQSRPPVQAAVSVPLRSRPKSYGSPKTKRSRRTSGRVSGSEQVCVSRRFQKTTCRFTASPQRCRHFRNLQRFRKRKCAKKCRPF